MTTSAITAPELHLVLSRIAQLLPMLQVTVVNTLSRSAQETIDVLYRHIVTASPDAGKVYWSARTWQVWSWQATYLNVLSCHLYGVTFDTSSFLPCIVGEHAQGAEMPEQAVIVRDTADAMGDAQAACLDWIDRYAPVIATYGAFSTKLAKQYTADSMLGALMYVQSQSCLSQQEAIVLGGRWTAALHLPKVSHISQTLPPQSNLMLHNAVCCQHYRRDKDNLCVGCPRRSNPKGQEAADALLT